MSDSVTRISLDAALDDDRTDWARLRELSDADIDAAMANDPDSFGLPRPASEAAYEIYQGSARDWRWRLRVGDGQVVAETAVGYASYEAVATALAELRHSFSAAEVRAA